MIDDSARREAVLGRISDAVGSLDVECILLTHMLSDRPAFIEALNRVARVAVVIAVPYSIDPDVREDVESKYTVVSPSLDQLHDPQYLTGLVAEHTSGQYPVVVVEIGGYFSQVVVSLKDSLEDRFLGVVEDTEAGWRRYETLPGLSCPVVGVARSSLKEVEDVRVGASCVFSLEKVLRDQGSVLQNKHVLVLGYGKVGRGLAYDLRSRSCSVLVYDIDPVRRALAYADGFLTPERDDALAGADVIFGASGTTSVGGADFGILRHGAILASCSSRDIEFDVEALRRDYKSDCPGNDLERFLGADGGSLYLIRSGHPVNFADGAVLGPVLTLVQAELIAALGFVVELAGRDLRGLRELDDDARSKIASVWLECFNR